MKKIICLFMMFSFIALTGCSCSSTGEYEFEAMVVSGDGVHKSYSCDDEEKIVDHSLISKCAIYEEREIKLTKKSKIIVTLSGVEVMNSFYKIEEDKLLVKFDENDTYHEYGYFENNKLIIEDEGIKIIFEK